MLCIRGYSPRILDISKFLAGRTAEIFASEFNARRTDRPVPIGDESGVNSHPSLPILKLGAPTCTQVSIAAVEAHLLWCLSRKALVQTCISPFGMSVRERFWIGGRRSRFSDPENSSTMMTNARHTKGLHHCLHISPIKAFPASPLRRQSSDPS